jgi:hypothetical protein
VAQNKNHHFVPQFYLRRFGADRFVALYNIARGQHVPRASIAGQCQRPYLYGKDQVIEKALCELEGAAARIIADIVERHSSRQNYQRRMPPFCASSRTSGGAHPQRARSRTRW